MTELLVGTKKGLFAIAGQPGGEWQIISRAFAGEPVEYALRLGDGKRVLATTTSPFYGPKLFCTESDPAGWEDGSENASWRQSAGISLPEGGDLSLERIWVIAPGAVEGKVYAGGDPGVLFESADGGEHWEINSALWQERLNGKWQPGGGGLCLHSIAPWPGDPERLSVAVSAAGVWHTEDGGRSWRRGNSGLNPRYLPEEVMEELNLPEPPAGADPALCVHHLERSPARPERMFMQFHGGVYRSDDGGCSWQEIGAGLPSDFGFPLAVDPADPDSAYVIPLNADMDRVMPEGRARVYETRDGGQSWTARGEGLPQRHAYLTVLRQAFQGRGSGESLELYFGTTTGDVFGSGDAGATWFQVAANLPPVHALSAG